MHFLIEEDHFKYLAIQKGNLSDHLYDRNFWQVQYDRDIWNTVSNVVEGVYAYETRDIHSVLDIGSGLGGFNAALADYLNDPNLIVGLVDGFETVAQVVKHSYPFNSMSVAKDFLTKNGLHNIECYPAGDYLEPKQQYDLIVSFQAWCFHFEPKFYLDFVKKAINPGRTVIVIDVRNEKPEWVLELVEAFGPFEVIMKKPKWSRMVFRPQ